MPRVRAALTHATLAEALFTQGFGSRRECAALIAAGRVRVAGVALTDPDHEVALAGLVVTVDGTPWPWQPRALLMLHKPAGHECSRQPSAWPSVLSLLPAPLRRRGVQPVGRLDQDTTGALLLTDDGALLHRLTSPRHHVPKTYEVTTADPLDATLPDRLRQGVILRDDPKPARALHCELTGTHSLRLVIDEGRYHQVKRMLAATGHRVVGLHRSAFGALALPADLVPGAWRWLTPEQAAALQGGAG